MELEAKGELLEAAKIYKAILEEDETNVVRRNFNESGEKEQTDLATKAMDRGCATHYHFFCWALKLLGTE
jgi:hypothetical protein